MQWSVYMCTSIRSGKSYIGLTYRGVAIRWKEHCNKALKGSEFHFHRAILLYGVDNWSHCVLASCIDTQEEAQALEKFYIKEHDTFENGYNLTWGGEGSFQDTARYTFYNPELGIKETSTCIDLAHKFNLHQGYVRYVANKKSSYVSGWFLWEGHSKSYEKQPRHTFEHADYGVECLSLKDMTCKYNLSKGNLHAVVNGTRNQCRGWTLQGNLSTLTVKKIANNARVVIQTEPCGNVLTHSSIKVAAHHNNVQESIIRDRCSGRCSKNTYKGSTFMYCARNLTTASEELL